MFKHAHTSCKHGKKKSSFLAKHSNPLNDKIYILLGQKRGASPCADLCAPAATPLTGVSGHGKTTGEKQQNSVHPREKEEEGVRGRP